MLECYVDTVRLGVACFFTEHLKMVDILYYEVRSPLPFPSLSFCQSVFNFH